MAYNAIGSNEVDADSPADATLWGKVKSNFDFLKDLFDISTGHTHDGSTADDGPLIATVADGGITVAKLVFSAGSYSNASLGTQNRVSFSTNRYMHINQSHSTNHSGSAVFHALTPYVAASNTTGLGFFNSDSINTADIGISWDYHS